GVGEGLGSSGDATRGGRGPDSLLLRSLGADRPRPPGGARAGRRRGPAGPVPPAVRPVPRGRAGRLPRHVLGAGEAWPSASPQVPLSPTRLKVETGREKPLRARAPTGSASTTASTVVRTRRVTRIWPGLASPQSRKARLVTGPMAP